MPTDCLLLLGSNVGDRRRALKTAVKELEALPFSRVRKLSRVYETAPVGPSNRPYLNLVAGFRTSLSPMGLLVELKRIETLAGRRPGKRWSARRLDVDILRYGDVRVKNPWLTIPHPRILERTFVLAPLMDLVPTWKPDGIDSIASQYRRLNPSSGTVRIYSDGL